MHPHFSVRELAPRKFFLSPIVIKLVKPVYCTYVWVLGGLERTGLSLGEEYQISDVLHASIFQTFIFHHQNEKTLFKTSKWKEKVLQKICLPLKWQLES